IAIIVRAHELCGIQPVGVNKQLVERVRERASVAFLAPSMQVGDFVLTPGPHVAEVCEIRTTEFGYASYRVKFLDVHCGPGVDEDWLPTLAVRLFMTRQDMVDGVRARFIEHSYTGSFTDDEIADANRRAILEA